MKFQLLIAGCVLLVLGCSTPNEQSVPTNTGTALKIEYAKNFRLSEVADGIQLDLVDPETDKLERSIVFDTTKTYRIISLTATVNGILTLLDAQDQLVGISDVDYVYNPEIKDGCTTGKISEFGDETSYSLEKIIASNATIILYSGFGKEFPNQKKLESLGITIVPIYDWRESHPLGKAEWMKLIGVITHKKDAANELFASTVQAYQEIAKGVTVDNGPTVISGNLIGDIWYAPGGNSYMATLIADAGGVYRYRDTKATGSIERSMEQIIEDNRTTSIWINPGMDTKATVQLINPQAPHLKAFNNMYCYSPNINKFWELSAAQPHLVLSDLIHIFHHPSDKSVLNFYEKLN